MYEVTSSSVIRSKADIHTASSYPLLIQFRPMKSQIKANMAQKEERRLPEKSLETVKDD
jgi:hypothetical protein